MSSKSVKIIAGIFILFIAAVIAVTSLVIYNTPVEITSVTAGNYTGNLMNGGNVLEDDEFLFFNLPGKDGIYRIETESGEDKTQISETGGGYLQIVGKKYYYSDGDKLISCGWGGDNKQTVLEYAKNPLAVGGSVFYIDSDGFLCRYSFQKQETTNLSVKPAVQVVVFSNIVYYIGSDSKIWQCDFEGKENKVFLDIKVDMFALDGKYMFFISDGWLYSAAGTDPSTYVKIVKADRFMVKGDYVIYNSAGKLWFGEMGKLATLENDNTELEYEPTKLADFEASGLSAGKNNFYYFDKDGTLYKAPYKTGETVKFS